MQDDWYDGVKVLKGADLSGKTVALFGCGDSESYPDTFVGGMAEIYNAAKAAGADVIGAVSTDGYTFDDSESVVDGHFAYGELLIFSVEGEKHHTAHTLLVFIDVVHQNLHVYG